jgi:hypothetical protein
MTQDARDPRRSGAVAASPEVADEAMPCPLWILEGTTTCRRFALQMNTSPALAAKTCSCKRRLSRQPETYCWQDPISTGRTMTCPIQQLMGRKI